MTSGYFSYNPDSSKFGFHCSLSQRYHSVLQWFYRSTTRTLSTSLLCRLQEHIFCLFVRFISLSCISATWLVFVLLHHLWNQFPSAQKNIFTLWTLTNSSAGRAGCLQNHTGNSEVLLIDDKYINFILSIYNTDKSDR